MHDFYPVEHFIFIPLKEEKCGVTFTGTVILRVDITFDLINYEKK